MGYASKVGRATTDPDSPSAHGICDRCGFRYLHRDLVWQYSYRGNALTNIRILVCTQTCLDVPFEFNKPIILPPDPLPIKDPRPEFFASDEDSNAPPDVVIPGIPPNIVPD